MKILFAILFLFFSNFLFAQEEKRLAIKNGLSENKIQISSENLSERYINLHLGLTSSDMWFK